jgi:hypothetical protein
MFDQFKCFLKVFLKILCVVNCRNFIVYCSFGRTQKIIDKCKFVNIFVRNSLLQLIRKSVKLKYLTKWLTVWRRIILGKLDFQTIYKFPCLTYKSNTQYPVRRSLPLAPVMNQIIPVPYNRSVRPVINMHINPLTPNDL